MSRWASLIWLNEVVDDLGLENVIGCARVPSRPWCRGCGYRDRPRRIRHWWDCWISALPILRGTGELLALKGRSAAEEITKAKKKLNRYGARQTEILTAGADLLEEPTTVVRVRL